MTMANMRLLVLWLTARCNLNCRYCYASAIPSGDMDITIARQAIDIMGAMGEPFKIQFTGGEPLLKADLMAEVMDYARFKNPGISFSLQTNGTLLDKETIRMLKKYQTAIGVSLDGLPETNERLRGKTREAVAGIALLGEAGLMVNLNTVVCGLNAEKLRETADMALYLGNVRGIALDPLRLAGRAADDGAEVKPASPSALLKGLELLRQRVGEINAAFPRKLLVREFEKAKYLRDTENPVTDYCYAGRGASFVVLPNGDCYPCGNLAGRREYFMGNVRTGISAMALRYTRPGKCGACAHKRYCNGGCPSRSLLNGGCDESDCNIKQYIFSKIEEREVV